MTPKEVLAAAADYLDQFGWQRESFRNVSTGACCVVGAIRYQAISVVEVEAALNAFRRSEGIDDAGTYQSVINWNDFSVINWNDFVCASKEQAVTALRKAAETAE